MPEAFAPSLDQKTELLHSMLDDACIDNKVKEFCRPKDEVCVPHEPQGGRQKVSDNHRCASEVCWQQ